MYSCHLAQTESHLWIKSSQSEVQGRASTTVMATPAGHFQLLLCALGVYFHAHFKLPKSAMVEL